MGNNTNRITKIPCCRHGEDSALSTWRRFRVVDMDEKKGGKSTFESVPMIKLVLCFIVDTDEWGKQ